MATREREWWEVLIMIVCALLIISYVFGCGSSEQRDKWRAIDEACDVCPDGSICEVGYSHDGVISDVVCKVPKAGL